MEVILFSAKLMVQNKVENHVLWDIT